MVGLAERFPALAFLARAVSPRREQEALDEQSLAIARENATTEAKTCSYGQHVARIPERVVAAVRVRYRPDFNGGDCWADQDFVRAFLRDNPQYLVRTKYGARGQELVKPPAKPRGKVY